MIGIAKGMANSLIEGGCADRVDELVVTNFQSKINLPFIISYFS